MMRRYVMFMLRHCAELAAVTLVSALMIAGAQATETITHFYNDISGTPQLATDASGNVLWKEGYSPYGERLVNAPGSASGSAVNQLYFHGKKVEDLNAGVHLSYFGARYYDPSLGRFLQSDPEGFNPNSVHSFNRYAYGNNNPYRYVDPDGHSPIDVAFLVWDIGKLGVAIYKGEGVGHAIADVAMSVVGVASPIPGTGQALKVARAADHAVEAGRAVRFTGEAGKAAKTLPDSAIACRGGICTAERFAGGSGVKPDAAGRISGVSVNSAPGKSVQELSEKLPNSQIGVTTVGDIRRAGGDVVSKPTANNPYHCEMCGVTAQQAEKLFTPTVRNPNR